MKKKGIFYRGYDSDRDLKEIEKPIRSLVIAMNEIPYITTFCSCAGHEAKREDNLYRYTCRAFVDFELLKKEYAVSDLFVRLTDRSLIDYPKEYYYLSKQFYSDDDSRFWQYKEKIKSEKNSKKREMLGKNLEDMIKNSNNSLTWFYRLEICGEGNRKKAARESLDLQIKTLETFFLKEK